MFSFPGQREGEAVLMVIRKHPIVYFKIILVFILTILLPLGLFLWLWFLQFPFAEHSQKGMTVEIFSSIYLLYGLLFSCVAWINEEFDLFILTDQRLMDITQESLFRHSVTSASLHHIQDATSQVNGFLPTVLHYGNIEIQTAAGAATTIFIDRVPDPGNTARVIMNAADHIKAVATGDQPSPAESPEDDEGL